MTVWAVGTQLQLTPLGRTLYHSSTNNAAEVMRDDGGPTFFIRFHRTKRWRMARRDCWEPAPRTR